MQVINITKNCLAGTNAAAPGWVGRLGLTLPLSVIQLGRQGLSIIFAPPQTPLSKIRRDFYI